jgi:hypothetical protein
MERARNTLPGVELVGAIGTAPAVPVKNNVRIRSRIVASMSPRRRAVPSEAVEDAARPTRPCSRRTWRRERWRTKSERRIGTRVRQAIQRNNTRDGINGELSAILPTKDVSSGSAPANTGVANARDVELRGIAADSQAGFLAEHILPLSGATTGAGLVPVAVAAILVARPSSPQAGAAAVM